MNRPTALQEAFASLRMEEARNTLARMGTGLTLPPQTSRDLDEIGQWAIRTAAFPEDVPPRLERAFVRAIPFSREIWGAVEPTTIRIAILAMGKIAVAAWRIGRAQ